MRHSLNTLLLALAGMAALAACEDVPAPYNRPGQGPGDTPVTPAVTPQGTGTEADPYNVAGVKAFIDKGQYAGQTVHFRGVVTSFKSGEEPGNSYGNATFYIADEAGGSNTFYCYRVKGFNNQKFTAADATLFGVGDTVTVCGSVTLYGGNTYETEQNTAWLVSVNGKTQGGGDQPTPPSGEAEGDGTEAAPYNVAGVNQYLDGAYDDTREVYFRGIVKKFKSGDEPGNSYGNATFYIVDSAGSEEDFYCYRVLGLNGEKFTSPDQLRVGDTVVVRGCVTVYTSAYGSTKETVQGKARLISINGKAEYPSGSGQGGDQPGPDVDPDVPEGDNYLTNGGFEAWSGSQPEGWKSASTASSATLEQSADAHGGSYAVLVKTGNTQNKRLAHKELTLPAGTYQFTFWAKPAQDNAAGACQTRAGHVTVTEGKVGTYVYGDYTTLPAGEWTLVTYEFTLAEQATVCPLLMNPKETSGKNAAQDILVDDAALVSK